jgi:hypothetical protein
MGQIVLTDNDLKRIEALNPDDLARLYEVIRARLFQADSLGETAAVSTRLPVSLCHAVSNLALRRRLTRSEVIREAVTVFVRGNTDERVTVPF